ncbi:MAG: uracil-DNA glycosylase [Clostridia bacterium]|nr:uracil-DNA glycosylase [Clostridia bacterium]MBR0445109.1 uracil-DNA glycosylase [Clostridia bacterium]
METVEPRLDALYLGERKRLSAFAAADEPQGEYASPVFGVGERDSDVVLIGEAPGAEETRTGIPFVGKAGKQLDQLLSSGGIDRTRVFVTNAVKYRPVVRSAKTTRNRTPSRKEILDSLPLLGNELELIRPAVIVTLGSTPLGAVLDLASQKRVTIGEAHGTPRRIRILSLEAWLFPLYHPASCIYNRKLTEVLEADAAALGRFLDEQNSACYDKRGNE